MRRVRLYKDEYVLATAGFEGVEVEFEYGRMD